MDLLPRPRPSVIPIHRKHPYISEPFSYPLPVPDRYKARFKPGGYHKNVFYGGRSEAVAIHEAAYYMMRERLHMPIVYEESRTLFAAPFSDTACLDISSHPNITVIMDRKSHAASWDFIMQNETDSLLFPSARTTGICVAVYDENKLGTQISGHQLLTFRIDREQCQVLDATSREPLHTIHWFQIS